ncbi:hypothetical protein F5B22DRAFT_473010 [Xylaria bambusicola]|uniref:uncharacterized protein n=1 Tax=Xylaria bambusicola TaxID=326684 RepID=UPI002007A110|nr:uncharacterized protein F5B22DRAFT_473010 [Xylaria bambusicola]KAI0506237.1 hypothetical protein F5B22DRAFT_473010 [Xylaria bambusicola]
MYAYNQLSCLFYPLLPVNTVTDIHMTGLDIGPSLPAMKEEPASICLFASRVTFSAENSDWSISQSSRKPATPVAAPVTSLTVKVAPPVINEENAAPTPPVIASAATITPSSAIAPASLMPPLPTQSAHSQKPTPIQRRNRERLEALATRIQNFNGSVTELLTVANVQEELDIAFDNLIYAQNQLKGVLRRFEVDGYITNRQSSKRYGALKDMTKATRRLGQLMNQLWNLQRC